MIFLECNHEKRKLQCTSHLSSPLVCFHESNTYTIPERYISSQASKQTLLYLMLGKTLYFCCNFLLNYLSSAIKFHSKHHYLIASKEAKNQQSRLKILKTWFLDSTVNWDSRQTEKNLDNSVLEKGKVLSQRCHITQGYLPLFQLILFTEQRHVRKTH